MLSAGVDAIFIVIVIFHSYHAFCSC